MLNVSNLQEDECKGAVLNALAEYFGPEAKQPIDFQQKVGDVAGFWTRNRWLYVSVKYSHNTMHTFREKPFN